MENDRRRRLQKEIAKALRKRAINEESLQRGEWFAALTQAAQEEGPRIQRLLQNAEHLLVHGFFEAAIVCAFTALEVCGSEVVVKTMFQVITWPFNELADYLESSIFGRNGKLQNLRRLLETGLAFDYPSKKHWDKLAEIQNLRNQIIHKGEQASEESAQQAVASVRSFVNEMLKTLTGSGLEDWTGLGVKKNH